MMMHQILPAAIAYTKALSESIQCKTQIGLSCAAETDIAKRLSTAIDCCYNKCEELRTALTRVPADSAAASNYYHDVIVSGMVSLRKDADTLEELTDKSYWPYPTYSDLLYY